MMHKFWCKPSYFKLFYNNNFEFSLCETSALIRKQITLLFSSESAWWNKLDSWLKQIASLRDKVVLWKIVLLWMVLLWILYVIYKILIHEWHANNSVRKCWYDVYFRIQINFIPLIPFCAIIISNLVCMRQMSTVNKIIIYF